MTVLLIIMGILLISGGFSCIFTPVLTFMQTGYFVVIMMALFSIVGIIRAIADKKFGVNFVFSILSAVLGIVMLAFPEHLLFGETVMLIMTAIWFVIRGIITIITSIKVTKAAGINLWVLQLIAGILDIIIGGYAFFQPMLMAVTLGVLIGIFFIETGMTLILGAIVAKE